MFLFTYNHHRVIKMKIKENLIWEQIDKKLLKEVKLIKKNYSKNQTVYHKGDGCGGIDIIRKGGMAAYTLASNGSKITVFEFSKGRVIGANLLFGNENSYPMNIYCTEDCELVHIVKEDVEKLLHDYYFTLYFIKTISLNSQGMHQKMAMYTQKSLRENLMEYLKMLSREQKSSTVRLPMSKKQLADYLGVQRPSLFRELKKMKEEQIIEVDNRKVHLL